MKRLPLVLLVCSLAVLSVASLSLGFGSSAQDAPPSSTPDPFVSLLAGIDVAGSPAAVPPRALAVIPERNTGRRIRVADVLTAIEPQFDDIARGMGLTGQRAIQLRTREANMPIFVAKTQTTIATLLQVPMGATIEVQGVVIERSGHFVLLASSVRQASAAAPRPAR